MNRKYITLMLNPINEEYLNNLENTKDFFSIEYDEASGKYIGFNEEDSFMINFDSNKVDLVFLKDISNERFCYWENKLVDFSNNVFLNQSILMKKVVDINNNQFRSLNS